MERLFLPSNSLNRINIADCFNDAQGTFEPHVFTFTSITETKQEKIWKGRQYLNDFFYDMKNEIVSDELKKKKSWCNWRNAYYWRIIRFFFFLFKS